MPPQSCGASPASSDSGPPLAKGSPMAQYINYVRTIYRLSEVEKNSIAIKWPPTPSKIYINLVCVDRTTNMSTKEADECTRAMICYGSVDVIVKKKRPITFRNVTRDLPDTALEKVILVEGAPGVGKSTFAWEFCRRWERGEIAKQYRLVLLLRLRDERISKAQSLADLIFYSSDHICQAVVEELACTLGVNTLIILEGFDELPSTCRTHSSVFLQLIHGQLLPLATVLVTSRPWATQVIHRECGHRIFQHIEILGFTGKQIEEYVTTAFTGEGKADDEARENIKEVILYIETYPQIRACMYIPLNSAIVVSVYKESKAGKCILPKSLTELYYTLIQILLLRYLYGHSEYGQRTWKIQSLKEDLPEDVYSKLLAICELAYSGICSDKKGSVQLIFTNLPPDFETLGMMQSVPQLYVIQGEDMSHNFLHLTVQEFLAALHISNMSLEQQLEHFRRQGKEGRWRVVLRFLAGITKLANLSADLMKSLLLEQPNERQITERDRYCITADVVLSSQHGNWMFETQRDDIAPVVLEKETVEYIGHEGLTSLDYYSLGYCIHHSHSHWVLTIQDNRIEEEDIRMLVAGVHTRCDTSARVVGLMGGEGDEEYECGGYFPLSISTEALNVLFIEMKNVIHLQELHLQLPAECSSITWPDLSGLRVLHLAISEQRNWRLDTLLPHLSLESLIIDVTHGEDSLGLDNLAAIKELFLWSNCPKHVVITGHWFPATAEVAVGQHVCEKKSVECIACQLDWYSVGCVIAHSNFQWLLTGREATEEEDIRMLVAGVNTRCDSSSRVVGLSGGGYWPLSISTEALNVLFIEMKNVIHLQELHLFLPAECSSITWPDLSGLRVLHLSISDERNWRLDTLLPHLSLESLIIQVTHGEDSLGLDNLAAIKELFLYSNCPKRVHITGHSFPATAEVAVGQHVCEKKSVEYITCQLGWYSVGYVIAHSNFQWVLGVKKYLVREAIGEEDVRMLVAGVNTRCNTSARVVGLRFVQEHDKNNGYYQPLSISTEALNVLFIEMKNVIHLQELYLQLPAECCSITWPDLSGLRVLHLAISDERNWRLDTLLPHLSLESLTFDSTRLGYTVVFEDCVAIGMLLSSSNCLEYLEFQKYEFLLDIVPQGMEAITKAMSENEHLPLRSVVIECKCTFSDTAAHSLAVFIRKSTTLHHLRIVGCTFSAHGLLELAQAIHHSSSLQERELEGLTCTEDGDDETTDCAKLLHHYPHVVGWLAWVGDVHMSHITDKGAEAIATALHHISTLWRLDLSNNSISNAGSTALAQALHHNSTLWWLNLSGNDVMSAEGTHQLVQALTVNTTVRKLVLPRRCEEYATQCPEYREVRHRIRFH